MQKRVFQVQVYQVGKQSHCEYYGNKGLTTRIRSYTDEGGSQEGKVWEDSQEVGERVTDKASRSTGTVGQVRAHEKNPRSQACPAAKLGLLGALGSSAPV